jgi:hypothetical protein
MRTCLQSVDKQATGNRAFKSIMKEASMYWRRRISNTRSSFRRMAGINEVMRFIHNGGTNAFRMPLFFTAEMELQWLDGRLTDKQMAQMLQYEMQSEKLEYWPVYSIRTTKLRPDNKNKTEPYQWPGLPSPGHEDQGRAAQASLF